MKEKLLKIMIFMRSIENIKKISSMIRGRYQKNNEWELFSLIKI